MNFEIKFEKNIGYASGSTVVTADEKNGGNLALLSLYREGR
jgi:hypothetical protein